MSKKTASVERRRLERDEGFVQKAIRHGAKMARLISPGDVVTANWVRWKCRYGCDGYGSSMCCPPYSPTPEETRRVLDEYSLGILFEAGRREPTRIASALERELFLEGFYRAFGMGAGPCNLCEKCAFDKGCRMADRARPSMEACGIDVFSTVRKQGFDIEVVRNRKEPQHYFGLVLVE